jgi:hypothetical protein
MQLTLSFSTSSMALFTCIMKTTGLDFRILSGTIGQLDVRRVHPHKAPQDLLAKFRVEEDMIPLPTVGQLQAIVLQAHMKGAVDKLIPCRSSGLKVVGRLYSLESHM